MKRRWLIWPALLALAAAVALGLAACGGDDDEAADTSGGGGGASNDIEAVLDGARRPRRASARWRRAAPFASPTPTSLRAPASTLGRVLRERLGDLQQPHAPHSCEQQVHGGHRGQRACPRPRHRDPRAVRGRAHLHLHAEGRDHLRPAGEPAEVTSQGHRLLVRAPRARPSVGAQYANYYQPIKGLPEFTAGDGQDDLGHHDARRQDDHLHADQARRRLPLPPGDAGHRADPRGGGASATPRPPSTAATSSPPART